MTINRLFAAISLAGICLSACTTKEPDTEPEVSEIILSDTELNLVKGDSKSLTATVSPSEALPEEGIIWTSSAPSIANVSSDGNVTALAIGTATVRASAGEKFAECKVTVSGIPAASITLDKTKAEMMVGDVIKLTATVLPEDADDKTVTWKSSDETVATVDTDGLVRALAKGSAEITAAIGDLSAVCSVTVTAPVAQPGDYYYSDGTYSSTLNPDKTVIGIIFWTGDPTADDKTLKNDCPQCTGGLVVSLENIPSPWQSGWSEYGNTVDAWTRENAKDFDPIASSWGMEEPLNKVRGYNNTKAIEAFNSDAANSAWKVDAVEKILEFRTRIPAPSSTSNWYLPSAKEISLLCSGEYDDDIFMIYDDIDVMELINSKISELNDADALSNQYWSSTEDADETQYAWYVSFYDGSVSSTNKGNTEFSIRPILAF